MQVVLLLQRRVRVREQAGQSQPSRRCLYALQLLAPQVLLLLLLEPSRQLSVGQWEGRQEHRQRMPSLLLLLLAVLLQVLAVLLLLLLALPAWLV